jgi:ribosomal protein S18 acetylase RimI-like enzyme
MAEIRAYREGDLEDIYRICLATGWSGDDASGVYADPKMVGHLYAAPYGVLFPECALVAEDAEGVAGYILGAADTAAFEAKAEADWWPKLREAYPDPTGSPPANWTPDQRLAYAIHHPRPLRPPLLARYPAHLHVDLLPRLQGQGMGRRMMDAWLALVKSMGARGAHLECSNANARALRFYRADPRLTEEAEWSNRHTRLFATEL